QKHGVATKRYTLDSTEVFAVQFVAACLNCLYEGVEGPAPEDPQKTGLAKQIAHMNRRTEDELAVTDLISAVAFDHIGFKMHATLRQRFQVLSDIVFGKEELFRLRPVIGVDVVFEHGRGLA